MVDYYLAIHRLRERRNHEHDGEADGACLETKELQPSGRPQRTGRSVEEIAAGREAQAA
jgi:hypothetical protein